MKPGDRVQLIDSSGVVRALCEFVSTGTPELGLVNIRLLEPLRAGALTLAKGEVIESPRAFVAPARKLTLLEAARTGALVDRDEAATDAIFGILRGSRTHGGL